MKELSLHILDIAQNSIRAQATLIEIIINESIKKNAMLIDIIDNGTGIDNETLKRVNDPYFTSRTTRKVGLGLSLFKMNAELTGGSLYISSKLGLGTKVVVIMEHNHLDRVPMGDIAGVVCLLASANPNINFVYKHITDNGQYIFDTNEIKNILNGVPINNPEVTRYLKEMIVENDVEG